MAAPAPLDKVKDKEYTNWLKVTLALYYMKSGLQAFIQSEVDCLHKSLVQKVYGGQTVPLPPCTMCHASHVKRNKYTGVWAFQKQCTSYCDVWLHELLKLHTNPKSEKMYWNNSDITSWPFKPWECAKVFMPRGQNASNAGPSDCDAQTLLTLLTSCTHFHSRLSSQGLGLTHTISSVRNNVVHNGEMKVSDGDRGNCVQQIIQLLEDPVSLKLLEACKTAVEYIHKITNDSVDVFFNVDLEVTALRASVNELSQELGMQRTRTSDTVDSLKEEYRQLREHITKRLENVETRMDTIERDVQLVKELTDTALQQKEKKYQEMYATMNSQHTEKIGNVETRMDTIERDVQLVKELTDTAQQQQEKKYQEMYATTTSQQQDRFEDFEIKINTIEKDVQSVMEQTDTALQQQEKKHQQSVETMSASIANQGIRLDTAEETLVKMQDDLRQMSGENNSCMKDVPTKRRPESVGLQQLKSQTEDMVDTFKRMGFIPTAQTEKAKTLLQEKLCVVIKGNPGEGKTSTALHLIDIDDYRNQRVVVKSPKDWKKVDTYWVKIVVFEDIFGKYDLDPGRLQEWIDDYLEIIQQHVDVGKLQVIITTRNDILLKANSKLKSFNLFSSSMSLSLSSETLKHSEKNSILNSALQKNKKNLNGDEIEQCIANFSGFIGFPQCCYLFARDKCLFDQGPKFFKFPEKLLVDNITNLKTNSFLSLAFLFCMGEIEAEYLSPSQIKKSGKYLPILEELAFYLNITCNESIVMTLRESFDHFSDLYVSKKVSHEYHSERNFSYKHLPGGNVSHQHRSQTSIILKLHSEQNVKKSCIQFSHATVYEAVGQVLGDKCPEMVVKYGHSEYVYHRTYTADAKDITSQNVFIPVSVHEFLADKMVHDAATKGLVSTIVKHSALKRHDFLLKLKDQLHNAKLYTMSRFFCFDLLEEQFDLSEEQFDLSEGRCITFLQYILKSDEDDVVRLVFGQFLTFLACPHNNQISDCWQCIEKQRLLEVALYYHQVQIADQLITMNACYTHKSLCNAARHGDLSRVQTILETLKRQQVSSLEQLQLCPNFNPECIYIKKALCRAFMSGNQDVITMLLQESITLDMQHVVDAVMNGDIDVLMKVVDHLKLHNKWNPYREQDFILNSYKENIHFLPPSAYISNTKPAYLNIPCTIALYISYCNEKFDMADYLQKNEAKVSIVMLAAVSKYSSHQAVARIINNMKATGTWDPCSEDASQTLATAFSEHKYEVCDMLINDKVTLTMKTLIHVGVRTLKSVKNSIQHLKDINIWEPNSDDASKLLEEAYRLYQFNVCNLLVQEGVSLSMKNLPNLVRHEVLILEPVKRAIQHLKDTDRWDPKCDDAYNALDIAFSLQLYDVFDLMVQEGVSLRMKYIPWLMQKSPDHLKIAVKHLKDTGNFDPKCDDASKAFEKAYCEQKSDVCDMLFQEGVTLTMKNLPGVVSSVSLELVKKAIQRLKDNDNWHPKCDDASKAFEEASIKQDLAVSDLLLQEGVSLKMNVLPNVVRNVSLELVQKVIQHLKDNDNWDAKCFYAQKALKDAYMKAEYKICDLLVENGVSLTMIDLPDMVKCTSLETVIKVIQHLKYTKKWYPVLKQASEAYKKAFLKEKYEVCIILLLEGISLTMKNFADITGKIQVSFMLVQKAIQHLKTIGNWDHKCYTACKALENAYCARNYDVYNLLVQEGVSLSMKNFARIIERSMVSSEFVKKAIRHLKEHGNWDVKCSNASKAFENAYRKQEYDVCDLLLQEGISLTMNNFPSLVCSVSLNFVKKAIQHLKEVAGNWDFKCRDASQALENAYHDEKYDVCELLVQEGVALTMENLPGVVCSLESVKKAIQHLKDNDNWDPKCDYACNTLANAYRKQKYDVCDLVIQEGVLLKMNNFPGLVYAQSLESVKKAIQHLKDSGNWDPKCHFASEVLECLYRMGCYDLCDFLVQEVSLTMKNLPRVVYRASLPSVKQVIHHLKEADKWDPKCDDASEALTNAYSKENFNVCEFLVQEGVSLTMKNLPGVILSMKSVTKAIQHLKDTGNWDPKCDDAYKVLKIAYSKQNYDVCDLLVQNFPDVIYTRSLESLMKVI